MPNMDILRARLAEIDSEYRAIDSEAGEARLSDEQQTRWDALDSEAAELRQSIADLEAVEARQKRVAESRARWGSVQVAETRADAFDLSGLRGLSGDALIDRARSAFDPALRRGASEGAAEVVRKIEAFRDAESSDAETLARYAVVKAQKD